MKTCTGVTNLNRGLTGGEMFRIEGRLVCDLACSVNRDNGVAVQTSEQNGFDPRDLDARFEFPAVDTKNEKESEY